MRWTVKTRDLEGLDVRETRGFEGLDVRWTGKMRRFEGPDGLEGLDAQRTVKTRGFEGLGVHWTIKTDGLDVRENMWL